jgi:hypothetical protein
MAPTFFQKKEQGADALLVACHCPSAPILLASIGAAAVIRAKDLLPSQDLDCTLQSRSCAPVSPLTRTSRTLSDRPHSVTTIPCCSAPKIRYDACSLLKD